jgi:NifU-like protein involved in Fe-S cluster formation
MNAPLYDMEILRLAASVPDERLADPAGSAEKRSPVCGSRVTVDVNLDGAGRVAAIGMRVRACALGQAASAVMHAHAIGRTPAELAAARDQLAAYLAGEGGVPDWPRLDIFARALPHRGRHASIRLAFEAAAEAAAQAEGR